MSASALLRAFAPAFALGAASLAIACADGPTAPGAPVTSAAPALAKGPGPAGTVPTSGITARSVVGDTTVTTLVLRPDGRAATIELGDGHTITFPAGAQSVCDPARASYGPGTWELPCAASGDSITITARTWIDHDLPRIEFRPALRFAPGKAAVVLALKNPHAKFPKGANRIDYCADDAAMAAGDKGVATGCADESIADPSVATQASPSGFWTRRVKHFSGYTVIAN